LSKRRRDYADLLLWSAVGVTTVRYAGAFLASDLGSVEGWVSTALSVFMGLTGVGMGILDVLGTAYIFDGWRRAMPAAGKRWPFRFRVLTVFVALMLAIGIGILVPFTVSRITHVTMAELLPGGWVWGWAGLVVAAPFVLIGGIATAQAHAFEMPAPQMEPQPEPMRPDATHENASKEPKIFVCPQCGDVFGTSPEYAAHRRWKHSNGNGNGNGHEVKEAERENA
jgi:uncharacterized C2H2 Zn-finger protein